MNRLSVLIPILIIAGLLGLVFVLMPMLKSSTEAPTSTKGADDLPPPPSVKVSGELEHKFGVVQFRGPLDLKHTFTVRNDDDHAITLEVEGTSCNCLAGELSKRSLKPGESAKIDVTLEVLHAGPTVQKVYLNANGALVILEVSADVVSTGATSDKPATSRH